MQEKIKINQLEAATVTEEDLGTPKFSSRTERERTCHEIFIMGLTMNILRHGIFYINSTFVFFKIEWSVVKVFKNWVIIK